MQPEVVVQRPSIRFVAEGPLIGGGTSCHMCLFLNVKVSFSFVYFPPRDTSDLSNRYVACQYSMLMLQVTKPIRLHVYCMSI